MPGQRAPKSDYDGRWKDVLDQYFEPFMGLLWPVIHADIDWSRRPRFLDKELQRLAGSAFRGRRHVDKLVELRLRNGAEVLLLVHVEVQGRADQDFGSRMFQYHYRLKDRYPDHEIQNLAVLTARTHGPRLLRHAYDNREGGLSFSFPVVNLGQWRTRWIELQALAASNPFAFVVMAQLEATVSQDGTRRLQSKTQLVRLLYERRYSRKDVQQLFQFIDGVLALPESLEPLFGEAVDRIEGEHDVAYVTSIERMAVKRGRQEGRQEGLQEGRQGAEATLRGLLQRKFGAVPDWADARIAQADGETLQRWTLGLLDADTVEAVFEA